MQYSNSRGLEVIEKARGSERHSLYQAILKVVKNLPFTFKKNLNKEVFGDRTLRMTKKVKR